ncbi:MAG TPA: DnaJ domain-containing protein, partial [Myxococcota bacterium]|nr:DnaJ domain-containing protein [Myxococcota bacterium]
MAASDSAPYLHFCPRPNPRQNPRNFDITPSDAYLWSRLDGATTLQQLADLVGQEPDAVLEVLHRLVALGLVLWPDDGGLAPAEPAAAHVAPRQAGEGVSPEAHPALDEPGDLSTQERLEILRKEAALGRVTHWELLGVSGDAGPAEVKKAYFSASKAYHPDRHFGKNLGSFRARLDRLFQGVKKAYDVLADPVQAEAYRASHPPPAPAAPSRVAAASPIPPAGVSVTTPSQNAERDRRLEEHRQAILAARRDRKQDAPVQGQRERARALVEQAEADMVAGRYAQAARAFGIAADMLPAQSLYASRAAEAAALVGDVGRARTYIERAVLEAPRH